MKLSIERNIPIDALRGFAIFLMVISNSYSYVFNGNPNILLRILLSSAAPIFIFLSGFTFQLSIEKNKSIFEIFKRIFQIFIVAILIDVLVWRLFPMQNFDVLYLISISMCGMIFLHLFSINVKMAVLLFFLIASFFIRYLFKYRFQITELNFGLTNLRLLSNFYGFDFIKRILIDGWFPIFPWFSIALLGNIVKQKIDFIEKHSLSFGCIGVILTLSSIFFYTNNFDNIYLNRNGYIELFYPVDLNFSLYLLGVLGIVFFVITLKSISFLSKLLFQIVGKYSLFFYFYHSIIIGFLLKIFFTINFKNNYIFGLIAIVIFWISILSISFVLEKYKSKFKDYTLFKVLFFISGVS